MEYLYKLKELIIGEQDKKAEIVKVNCNSLIYRVIYSELTNSRDLIF